MPPTLERRTLTEPVEFRGEGKSIVAHGYAMRWDKLSQNLGGFVEQVARGAATKTIKEQDIRALFNHNESALLGRNVAGTLRLEEDDQGVPYEIDIPDTSTGRDVATLLERGDISGSSFGFRTIEDDWGETDSGFPLRTLKQVSLRDVGPVTFPAYTDSSSSLRSLAEARSLDIDVLVAAAEAGELRALILPDGEHRSTEEEDGGRETPTVVRPRLGWMYA